MKNESRKKIFLISTSFLSGCFFVWLAMFFGLLDAGSLFIYGSPITADSRLENGKYKFIKPILNSGYGDEDEALKWFPAERKLKSLIQDIVDEDNSIETGIFFLNLKNSGWFSVNASNTFIPASLLKLPMLISYYKLSESEVGLFDQRLVYEGDDFNTLRNFGNGTIVPGKTYTIRELLNEMIINSDNNALMMLYKYRQDSLKSIFDDMKIPLPSTDSEISEKDFVTTRDIARFLLVLYNASYLSRENSEEALQLLSQTAFKDGLLAGVPQGVVVSHKFGEREVVQAGKKVKIELHDCGIVYHTSNPYILCIMTKGADLNLEKLQIQKISKTVFNAVSEFSEGVKK